MYSSKCYTARTKNAFNSITPYYFTLYINLCSQTPHENGQIIYSSSFKEVRILQYVIACWKRFRIFEYIRAVLANMLTIQQSKLFITLCLVVYIYDNSCLLNCNRLRTCFDTRCSRYPANCLLELYFSFLLWNGECQLPQLFRRLPNAVWSLARPNNAVQTLRNFRTRKMTQHLILNNSLRRKFIKNALFLLRIVMNAYPIVKRTAHGTCLLVANQAAA